jgi:serine/threonine protein kinase
VDGTPFGRYRLISLIGRGGMGEVWRAHDTDTDRIVAIKVLPANFSDNADFKQRFRREAHAAARLNTPHVVPIHNYGEIDGRLYVDMRLIEGRDLQTVLAAGPIEPERAVRTIEGIALALHAAHEVGLVHRDVKPSNILLDRHDFAYLIDFGIARAADETRLTKSGNTIGTFAYIAPERLGTRAEEDARADIYSLTCVLYECLTGRPPFDEATMAQLVAAHLHTPPPQPSKTQPNVPEKIDPVIATGMAKDPDKRYQTAHALATAAGQALRAAPSAAVSAPTLLADPSRTRLAPAPARADEQLPPPHPSPPGQPPSEAAPQPIGVLPSAATQARPSRNPKFEFSKARGSRKRWLVPVSVLAAIVLVGAITLAWHPWRRQISQVTTTATTTVSPITPPQQTTATPTAPQLPQGNGYALAGCYKSESPPTDRPVFAAVEGCMMSPDHWLSDMSWSSWGPEGADGTGLANFKICEPDCAQGYQLSNQVVVHAWNPQRAAPESGCPAYMKFYADIIFAFPKSVPSASSVPVKSNYNGMPAVHYTSQAAQDPSDEEIGNPTCMQ